MKKVALIAIIPWSLIVLVCYNLFRDPTNYNVRCSGTSYQIKAHYVNLSSGGCIYLRDRFYLTQGIICSCDFVGKVEK